jgi:DNA replication and repair protein RecF
MPLTRLDITDFRNMVSINVEPLLSGFNLFFGLNGSGKTSLLEAIYYLSLGRSFRSTTIGRVIRNSADRFLIFAHSSDTLEQQISIGIERQQEGEIKIRIAGKDVRSTAELADLTPVQLIHSHCYHLLDGGPLFRRKYLDWGVFYINNDFLRIWRGYVQVLKQRNAALRMHRSKTEVQAWTDELIPKAAQLDALRQEYINQLFPLLLNTVGELIALPGLHLGYYRGWDADRDYGQVLQGALDRDMQLGYTQFGPHRADIKVTINRVFAKDILSRGQQKLFVCAMILAQGALLNSCANKKPIYLIDDLPAELDVVSRTNLIALLSKQQTQIFVTALERHTLVDALATLPLKMFHVEQGKITEVI